MGEAVEVLVHGERDWIQVRGSHDGYMGWCDGKMLQSTPEFRPNLLLEATCSLVMWPDGSVRYVPAGSWLFARGGSVYAPDGCEVEVQQGPTAKDWRNWLGAPYQWGGRTAMGVDCSGFMQVWARLHAPETFIDRDAADQIHLGQAVHTSDHLPGDWAFFKNSSGRVVHVGLVVAPEQVVHAAGQIRLDRLTAQGIERTLPDGRTLQTHALAGIRRQAWSNAACRSIGEQR